MHEILALLLLMILYLFTSEVQHIVIKMSTKQLCYGFVSTSGC